MSAADDASAHPQPRARPLVEVWRQIRQVCVAGVMVLLLCGTLVRLTVRDHALWTGLVYYFTSPAAMVVLTLGGLVMTPAGGQRCRRLLLCCLPVFAGWTWCSQYVTTSPVAPPVSDRVSRLMLWNACDGQLGWSRVEAVIRDVDSGSGGSGNSEVAGRGVV